MPSKSVEAVPLDKITPGSRLARDVRDAAGRKLMLTGQILESRHIEVFSRRGITEVYLYTDKSGVAAPKAALEQAAAPQSPTIGSSTSAGQPLPQALPPPRVDNPSLPSGTPTSDNLPPATGLERRLTELFAPHRGDPLMEELFKIAQISLRLDAEAKHG